MGRIDVNEGLAFASSVSTFLSKAIEAGTNHYRAKLKDAVGRLNILYPEIARLTKVSMDYSEELEKERNVNAELKRENSALRKMIRDNFKEEV